MNKKVIVLLTILALSFLIFKLASYLLIPLFTAKLRIEDFHEMQWTKLILGTVENFVHMGFNLVIGVYLFTRPNQIKYMSMLWFVIGALYGIYGLLFYFLVDISNKLDNNKKNE